MDKQEISNSISEHAIWKLNLNSMIHTGKLDIPIEKIGDDKACAFGKWFSEPAAAAELKSSEHYKKVKKLHAEFHKIAAKVADLASKGEKAEAEKLMEFGGEFAAISSKLTEAMLKWKDSIEPE